ncbi:hypothetical protein Pmani_003687 [Petrolisthes manimaculis]|uniref:Uncharacterized protein n=1 Tax=Petrolisthes manimaculis TaxID=1843537 RepID=A0AAE1UPR6_9EUCA|nr:hypothetical protein Pmani_003687 [Petrolisthes manimaculis]
MVYKSLIRSKIDYGVQVYGSTSEATLRSLDVFQNVCLRLCLGALRCTRVERMEVETNIPPLRIRRDHLLISYGITTNRKRSLAIPACGILLQWEHLLHGALESVAVRLHFLCQALGYDLSSGDRLIVLNIAPWESSPTDIITHWLPTAKSQAPEVELVPPPLQLLSKPAACRRRCQACLQLLPGANPR